MNKLLFSFASIFLINSQIAYAQQPVFVAPVKQESFYDVIESIGTVKAFDTVEITTETAKKLTQIHVTEGSQVKKGDLLFTLDKREEEADLAAAKSALYEAKRAYERAKSLRKKDVVSDAIYQERKAAYETQKANVEAVEARLTLREIRAPFSGVLGIIDMSVGTFVQPGDVMATLDHLSKMKVDFSLPSRYLSDTEIGDKILLKTDAYDIDFMGKVTYIDTQVDPVTRTLRVRAVVENEKNLLKNGMLAKVNLLANPRKSLTIPEESIIKRGKNDFVFKVVTVEEGKQAQYTKITLGQRKYGVVEVLEGLKEGDQIIHHGVMKVKDGAKVKVKAVEAEKKTLKQMLKEGK